VVLSNGKTDSLSDAAWRAIYVVVGLASLVLA
jgi:hypothetical protein